MNPFKDIKQHKKLLLLFLMTLCISCIIAPVVKVTLDSLLKSVPFMTDLLNYKHGSYDFGKVMRRILFVVAILIIFLFRKSLMFSSFGAMGIKYTRGCKEQLQMGFLLSTGIFSLYIAFLCVIGIRILQMDTASPANIVIQLLKTLVIAGLVGFVEEVFFRGYIFQGLLKEMQTVTAVCVSSLIYSLLHFFKIKLLVSAGIHPFIGFIVIYQSFKNIIVNFISILPLMTGLFLVGVVLSYACLRTHSLYLAIGLHTGWIFLIRTNTMFFDHVKTSPKWLFGDGKVITGVVGWSILLVMLIFVHYVTETHYNGKNPARTL